MEKKENEEKKHDIKHDTTEKKEHKTVQDIKVKEIKADGIKRDSIRVRKSTLWMIISGVLIILLIILMFMGFKEKVVDDKNNKNIESNQNSFIFMNSDGCTTLCD